MPTRHSPRFPALILALACLLLYLPTLGAGFVWDARQVVMFNDYIKDLRHLPDVLTLRVMSLDIIDNNRPLFLLSVMLDWAVWGGRAAGFHLTNILLHTVSAVLLFLFARRLTGGASPWPAFIGALLFAVHPVNCEPVAEVSYRKDLIAAAGILGALNLAALFRPSGSWKNLLLGFGCAACLFLAVAVKENGVAGPLVLAAYWLLFRRAEPKTGWCLLCAASALGVAAFLAARFTLQPFPSMIFTEAPPRLGGSFAETLRIQPRIWAFYFRQIILPMDLCADYTSYSLRNFSLGASLAGLAAAVAAQVFFARKSRVACLGTAFFWLSLLPVSNFIPIYRPMADRFLYLPMCGVALMIAAAGATCFRHPLAGAGAGLAAGVMAMVTFSREDAWHDNLAIWRDAAEKNPFSYTAANNFAEELLRTDPAAALAAAQRADRLVNGTEANPFATAALALEAMGRKSEADAAYREAQRLDARYRNPSRLVRAMVWGPDEGKRLEALARRN